VGGKVQFTSQSDHAAAQKKMLRLIEEELRRRRKVTLGDADNLLTDILLAAFCWDHKRTNMAGAAEAGDQEWLIKVLGAVKDPGEWGQSILTAVLRQAAKVFGHRANAYEFGHGVKDFPAWLKITAKNFHYAGMLTIVGNRNDVYFENAMVVSYMADKYVEYLFYLRTAKKDGHNKLEAQLIKGLGCDQVLDAIRARAFLWNNIFQPLRDAANSTDMGLSFMDMEAYAQATEAILHLIASGNCPDSFFTVDAVATIYMRCPKLNVMLEEIERYRTKGHPHEIKALYRKLTLAKKAAIKECLALQAGYALQKFRCFASSQLVSQADKCGHKDYCPKSLLKKKLSPKEQAKLAKTPPVNRNAERLFSLNDLTRTRFLNASQYVVSGMTSARENGTVDWLYGIEDVQERDAIIMFTLSKEGMVEGKRQADEAEVLQETTHHDNETTVAAKAESNRIKRVRRWLKLTGQMPAVSLNVFSTEYQKLGTLRNIGVRREWLERQMALLVREGVDSSEFPNRFTAEKKKVDPDELFLNLKPVLGKWGVRGLKMVADEDRVQDPNKVDPSQFAFRANGKLSKKVEELLAKEKKQHAMLAERVTKELEEEEQKKAQGHKQVKKKPAKKSRSGGKQEITMETDSDGSEADETDSEGEALDSDEEEEAAFDIVDTFTADMRQAKRASLVGVQTKPTKRQRGRAPEFNPQD
jgi:hypothetical protein